MRKMTVSEMRDANGGAYICTTRTWVFRNGGQGWGQCGRITLTASAMGWHFLLAHNMKNCSYRKW